jgi:hypothetical protein
MNLFGLSPYLTLPKYWSYQIFLCLFGLLPIFWLPIGLHVVVSQILANILANPWATKSCAKILAANFGRACLGSIQTAPYLPQ